MKKQYVSSIKIGESINEIFILADKQIFYKRDGSLFISAILSDKTGQIKAIMWDHFNDLLKEISIGDFVAVRGFVGEYKKKPQLVLKEVKLIIDEKMVEISDFLPVVNKNIDDMFNHLVSITDTVNDGSLQSLIQLFWEDDCFVNKFKRAPAAKYLHHAYIGGLLEHTLSMAIIGEYISGHYGSNIDRDLLLSGIVLHDIGKVEELSYTKKIDYTSNGRLLSHIVIGTLMLDDKIKKIPDFPKQVESLLKHLIVSHHGSKEFGSPAVPQTMEAILLNCIDDMDFRINNVSNYIGSDMMNGSWTFYNKFMGRHFYKKER